ncbi:hypothetical protein BC938DRAFT_473016 [Jimgerdemannia flammicorona]|uniref:GAR domain-containing protein n=1 Tax=Jimgerdemannia flammicorona TaxID=994334 RepID=A0A433Q4X5_9FUNG|nr:hypothetical protein BC938DRAFT_473016 [Jimgerdemannia flammicorona]
MQITLPAPSGPYQYPDRDRAVSPTGGNKRTSKSPSLIPRPRTPLVSGSRPTSPSEVADDGFKPGFLRATTPNSNRPLTPSNLSAVAAAIATSPPPPVPKLPTEYASILSSASSQNSLLSVVNEAYPATVAAATSQASDPPNNASVRKSNIPRKSFTPVLTKKPSISHLFQQSNGDSGTESPKQSISSTLNQIYRTHEDDYDDYMRSLDVSISEPDPYTPDPRDPLDVELAKVLNSSPIRFKCERLPQGQGKYSFGSELNRKVYMCKLMNYKDKEGSSGRRSMVPGNRNKVLVRVGGGWQDLEAFLFDHMDLMMSNVTVKRW